MRDALEPDPPERRERRGPGWQRDHGAFVDHDLAWSSMTGDPSGEVDRLPVDIAIADDDEPSGDPGMCRRQPGRLDVGDEPENRPDSVGGTAETQ